MTTTPLRACLAALALLMLAPPATGLARPPSVEIIDMPARLTLPLAAGTNQLFSVRVSGDPEAVWVAATQDDTRRLDLSPAGDTWAFNLGDARVVATLEGATTFQVFARFSGDKVVGSLPVQFTAAAAAYANLDAIYDDGVVGPRSGWIAVERVKHVRVRWSEGRRAPVELVSGGIMRVVDPGLTPHVDLPLDDPMRTAWMATGMLSIVRDGSKQTLRAIPSRIDLTAVKPFKLTQRRRGPIPGTRSYLTVSLGDISGSKVSVTISAADGTRLVESRLVGQGEPVEFALSGGRYALVIDRLVNLLMGQDHAEMSIRAAGAPLQPPKSP